MQLLHSEADDRLVDEEEEEEEGRGIGVMSALLAGDLTPAEESELEEALAEPSPLTRKKKPPAYRYKARTPASTPLPRGRQTPSPTQSPPPRHTPSPLGEETFSPSPPSSPTPLSPPRLPPLPRCISQYRGDNWFEHHYPRARPELFDHIRPPPLEDGQPRQIPLASVVDMLCSRYVCVRVCVCVCACV